MLEVIKLSLVNERLNLSSGFENPHTLVAEDIGVRSKLDLIEDLLNYDDQRRKDIAEARAKRATNPQA